MNILKNISIINKFIKIFETGKEINLSGFSDSEKSILIYGLNGKLRKKTVVVASDLISASNLENMLLSLNLKVSVLKESVIEREESDWQKLEKQEQKKKQISKLILDFCNSGDVLIVLPNCLNQNVSNFKHGINSGLLIEVGSSHIFTFKDMLRKDTDRQVVRHCHIRCCKHDIHMGIVYHLDFFHVFEI